MTTNPNPLNTHDLDDLDHQLETTRQQLVHARRLEDDALQALNSAGGPHHPNATTLKTAYDAARWTANEAQRQHNETTQRRNAFIFAAKLHDHDYAGIALNLDQTNQDIERAKLYALLKIGDQLERLNTTINPTNKPHDLADVDRWLNHAMGDTQ